MRPYRGSCWAWHLWPSSQESPLLRSAVYISYWTSGVEQEIGKAPVWQAMALVLHLPFELRVRGNHDAAEFVLDSRRTATGRSSLTPAAFETSRQLQESIHALAVELKLRAQVGNHSDHDFHGKADNGRQSVRHDPFKQ